MPNFKKHQEVKKTRRFHSKRKMENHFPKNTISNKESSKIPDTRISTLKNQREKELISPKNLPEKKDAGENKEVKQVESQIDLLISQYKSENQSEREKITWKIWLGFFLFIMIGIIIFGIFYYFSPYFSGSADDKLTSSSSAERNFDWSKFEKEALKKRLEADVAFTELQENQATSSASENSNSEESVSYTSASLESIKNDLKSLEGATSSLGEEELDRPGSYEF